MDTKDLVLHDPSQLDMSASRPTSECSHMCAFLWVSSAYVAEPFNPMRAALTRALIYR